MLPTVFLLFVLVPIIEIAVLLNVSAAIGWLTTIAIVILTAILGTWMLRQQGLATLMKARQRMQSGQMPAQQMVEGMILLVGGALLLTPGFVTDTFGFACLLPPTRALMAHYLGRRARIGVSMAGSGVDPRAGQGSGPEFGHRSDQQPNPDRSRTGSAAGTQSRRGDVIDGEYRRED